MCGICGWVDPTGEVASGAVRAMMGRLAHRGPDGEGLWSDPSGVAVLGHTRLRIVDLDPRADQPMVDPSGAVLVFNGELYGFAAHRAELERRGERFRTTGDTEVLLRLVATGGVAALEPCVGMFAFAVWWPAERRLLLMRDRLGIKPLFWARTGSGVAFASELPALAAHPAVRRSADPDDVARWLQLGYSPAPRTLLRGVRRVPAGGWVELTPEGLREGTFYDLVQRVTSAVPVAPDGAAEALSERLVEAVRLRLVADVPLGCFLSSGVDSTAIVAAAAAAGARPGTLTVVAEGGEDESAAAVRTAAALGLEPGVERCRPGDLLALADRWVEVAGDPLADPSLLPTLLVSRAARERWTVALSGDGGDELTGGYPRLGWMPRIERLLAMPRGLRPRIAAHGPRWAGKLAAAVAAPDRWTAYQALQGVWPSDEVSRLLGGREVAPPWPEELLARLEPVPRWRRYRLLDAATFLPERVLAKVDRASMSCSLEVRVPLLDHRVAELLLAAPREVTAGKRVLREAIARLRGPQPARHKLGFEIPLGGWLRGPLARTVEAAVGSDALADHGVDRGVLRRVWDRHRSGAADLGERLLAVVVLDRWLRAYV